MDAPVTEAEVRDIIKDLKTRSAPGPDGFSAIYYKTFADSLTPYLVKLFNSGTPLNRDLNSALLTVLTVLPKPNKDASDVSNYRPISLMNNDIKTLTKLLTNRLSSFIALYVHKDQSGFIPGRQGTNQIRRAVDLVSLLGSAWDGGTPRSGILLSLDLQKAFDTVSWPYIFAVLEQWGFGPHFTNTLKALNSLPSAQMHLQGCYSDPLPYC